MSSAAVFCLLALAASANAEEALALHDMRGNTAMYDLSAGRVTVAVFVSARCPISNAFNFRLNNLYKQFGKDTQFLVINANANESLDEIRTHARAMEYEFPVYQDLDNRGADALNATMTPQAFVIDGGGKIIYRGYIEDAPNTERAKDPALRRAIEAALTHQTPAETETHGRGCAIIRRKG